MQKNDRRTTNPYLTFLMIELARVNGLIKKDLEYDLTWEAGEDYIAEFGKSKFNFDTKGVYECFEDFLKDKKTKIMKDSTGKEIKYGMTVDAPEPNDSDNYNYEFTGEVTGFHGEYVTVADADGDYFDIEPNRLTISED